MSAKKSVRELVAAGTWEKLSREEQTERVIQEIHPDTISPPVKGRPLSPFEWETDKEGKVMYAKVCDYIEENYPDHLAMQDFWRIANYVDLVRAHRQAEAEAEIAIIYRRSPISRTRGWMPPDSLPGESVLHRYERVYGWVPR